MSEADERDARARLRALEPAASFIVQAPAGSGKTELLIQRFLVLLARVRQPEEILAITFTRKAAAEMRARLVRALESASQPEPTQAHHKQTWRLARAALARDRTQSWRLLEHPLRLRVRTVDGFCAGLTRRMPWLSRLGDAPTTTDDAHALYEEAARNLLRRVFTAEPGADQVARLLRHRGNDLQAVKGLLADMLACRDQWLRHVLGRSEDQRRDLERALEEVVAYELKELVRLAPEGLEADLPPLAAFAAEHCPADGKDAVIRRLADCTALPGGGVEDCESWQALAQLLLTDKGAWRKPKGLRIGQGFPAQSQGRDRAEKALFKDRKEQMGVLLTALADEEDFRLALIRVRSLPPAHYPDHGWALLESLMALLPQAVAELRLVFSARGLVDHIEQAMAAAHALGDPEAPSDLALALDYQLNHILMDEFQDTSQSQFRLLDRLLEGWEPGDGRSLFLVGDPMQSIYRFREADVGLFLRAKEQGVGPVALEYLRLSRNFRSRPGVVDWVNEVFAQVMPKAEEPLTGAVAYSPSQAVRAPEAGESVQAHALASREQEAERAAELAARALADSDDTVAILVRARGHLPEIVRALRLRELRFQAVDIDPLAERGVIQDLWSLTRALRHRRDRLAWFSVLRAPWAGLRLPDLQALSDGAGERDLPQTLLDFASVQGLSRDACSRLERLTPCIAEALDQVRRVSLRSVVEKLWLCLGGPACYPAEEVAEADRFLNLLSELEEGGDLPDTQAMARRLQQLYAAPDPQADGRLQIMTLHKAKGLEFGTVILPGLDRGTRAPGQKLLVWLERHAGEGGLLAGTIREQGGEADPVYRYIGQVDKDRDAHETGRLLYVAATRARDRLHLLGRIPCKSTEAGYELASPAQGSFLDKLWFVLQDPFRQAMDRLDVSEPQPEPREEPRILLQRLPPDWQRPEPPQPPARITGSTPPAQPMDGKTVEFDWARLLTRNAGTVVHRYLKAMAEQGLDQWNHQRIEANQAAFRALLEQLGTAPEDMDTALERVVTALRNVLDDERATWILGPHEQAGCEVALSGLLDGRLIHRIVDRSFVDAGERWSIDYKTGIHEGGSREGFLHAEEERYREQLQTYGRLYRIMEDRPVRLALYFPLMRAFREVGCA